MKIILCICFKISDIGVEGTYVPIIEIKIET
jgi:hypothetical protein